MTETHAPHLPHLHLPHPHIAHRKTTKAALISDEHVGFNGRLAVIITKGIGSMWCAYAFAALALISLPDAIHQGTVAVVSWISQTFLQLVLLSVIMVGQQVLAKASDKQALQTFKDTEAILELTDQVHRLIAINNRLTDEIHNAVAPPAPPTQTAPA
jgi:hypothetical protein